MVRDSGGFYNVLNKVAENEYAEFSLTLRPDKDRILRTVMVSLSTTNLPEEMLTGTINPLNLIAASVPNFTGDYDHRSI